MYAITQELDHKVAECVKNLSFLLLYSTLLWQMYTCDYLCFLQSKKWRMQITLFSQGGTINLHEELVHFLYFCRVTQVSAHRMHCTPTCTLHPVSFRSNCPRPPESNAMIVSVCKERAPGHEPVHFCNTLW